MRHLLKHWKESLRKYKSYNGFTMAEVELARQRTEEARKVAEMNKDKATVAEQLSNPNDLGTVKQFLTRNGPSNQVPVLFPVTRDFAQKVLPIKLKGVRLPNSSGEDKGEYGHWKAAFMSIVDRQNIPVSEKMLRLQSSLSGKALIIVKDLGYSASAFQGAKEKLEKKYDGQRRQQIKHLTSLRNWKKIRSRNLEDLEDFQAVLERVSLAIQDCGSFQLESLNLTAKEKLSEQDIQSHKHWLLHHF